MYYIYAVVLISLISLLYLILRSSDVSKLIALPLASLISVTCVLAIHFYILPPDSDNQIKFTIKDEYSFVDTLEKKSPEEYQAFIDGIKSKMNQDGINDANFISLFMSKLLIKYGPHASNSSLYNYLVMSVRYDKELIKIDPVLVLYHEFPEKFDYSTMDFSKVNMDEYNANVLTAANDVIVSGLEHPLPLITPDEEKKAVVIFKDVIGQLANKYSSKEVIAVLSKPNDPLLDKKLAAEIVIAFYDKIIALGKDEAAIFIKAALMTNQAKPKS